MKAVIASVFMCLSMAFPVLAQEAQKSEDQDAYYVMQSQWPDKAHCNADMAQAVDLEILLKKSMDYHGQCLSTRGFLFGRALFLDPDDTAVKYALSSKSLAGRRLGIYASDEVMQQLRARQTPEYIEIIGLVQDCQDLNGPKVIMVLGYCHYTGGPIMTINSFKAVREPSRFIDN